MKVAVTGAAGHLAPAIVAELSGTHDVVPLARHDLDITDRAAALRIMRALNPDAIVNCAAYNDVDRAQSDPGSALDVNAFGVLSLAKAAESTNATLLHFSTDFVFDGEANRPYLETDRPRPMSTYGCSKLLGEWFTESAERHYVLRVESIFGGPTAGTLARDGSLGTIVRKLRAGDDAVVFRDRTVSPSYAPHVAVAVREILERRPEPGLYHCVNSGAATWEELAREVAALLDVEPRVKPISMNSVPLPAPRPRYCAMDPSKLGTVGIVMAPWQEALRAWLRPDRAAV